MIAVVGEALFDAHVDGDEFRLFPGRSVQHRMTLALQGRARRAVCASRSSRTSRRGWLRTWPASPPGSPARTPRSSRAGALDEEPQQPGRRGEPAELDGEVAAASESGVVNVQRRLNT